MRFVAADDDKDEDYVDDFEPIDVDDVDDVDGNDGGNDGGDGGGDDDDDDDGDTCQVDFALMHRAVTGSTTQFPHTECTR